MYVVPLPTEGAVLGASPGRVYRCMWCSCLPKAVCSERPRGECTGVCGAPAYRRRCARSVPGESVPVYVVPLPTEGGLLGASPGESVAVYVVPLPTEGAVLGASPGRV